MFKSTQVDKDTVSYKVESNSTLKQQAVGLRRKVVELIFQTVILKENIFDNSYETSKNHSENVLIEVDIGKKKSHEEVDCTQKEVVGHQIILNWDFKFVLLICLIRNNHS